jgi:hypothetical protein
LSSAKKKKKKKKFGRGGDDARRKIPESSEQVTRPKWAVTGQFERELVLVVVVVDSPSSSLSLQRKNSKTKVANEDGTPLHCCRLPSVSVVVHFLVSFFFFVLGWRRAEYFDFLFSSYRLEDGPKTALPVVILCLCIFIVVLWGAVCG